MTVELLSQSPQQTRDLGIAFGQHLQPGDVICLCGDLGAGKTTFSAGMGAGWGAIDPLTSPTFVIVHAHERPKDATLLYHLDAYRLTNDAAAESVGLEDILSGQHVVLVEWAEQIPDWLPPDTLWITFRYGDEDNRLLSLNARGRRAQLLATLLHDLHTTLRERQS